MTLKEPRAILNRSVLLVGGGASALDLLDLAVQHGASNIAWSHRGVNQSPSFGSAQEDLQLTVSASVFVHAKSMPASP